MAVNGISRARMSSMQLFLRCFCALLCGSAIAGAATEPAVPILLYHRVGPVRADSMTVTTVHFKQQLDLLRTNGFCVIPLERFLAWRLGSGPAPAPKSVVVTFDDGHASVYHEARSLLAVNGIPVTLFIYPSCISHASYAMTWDQLSELAATPSFKIESHTFWHPNFKQESKKLDRDQYEAFVDDQLRKSKAVLEEKLGRPVTLLAWPFGIYDTYLMSRASAAGYTAAFSIECRAATGADPMMALPRCIVSDEDVGPRFLRFIENAMALGRN